jgi:alanyl-tRNA synthetase
MHYKPLTEDEIYKIEDMVNKKILDCLEVKTEIIDIKEAKSKGAMALFEEKYGQKVRVVTVFDQVERKPFSVELCGGTHCKNTGEIGMFKILSESSLGTNLRRIEAICGRKVYDYLKSKENILEKIAEVLGSEKEDLVTKIEKLIKINKELSKELNNIKLNVTEQTSKEIEKEVKNCLVVIKSLSGVDGGLLRNLSDKLVDKYTKYSAIIILYSQVGDKINVILRLTKKALEKNFSLENISKVIKEKYNIKTGGRKDFLQGGGKLEKIFSEQDLSDIVEKSI